MSSKADKKRHKRKLKLKEKRKAARTLQKENLKLKYAEYLAPFAETIFSHYTMREVSLYRWMHNPEIPDDFLPQIFQENDPRSLDMLAVPELDDPDDVILRTYVDYFTFSNFDTLEHAEKEYVRWIDHFGKRKNSDEKIKTWIKNKGLFIEKINYTLGTALIGETENNGHTQTLLMDGVDPVDLVDRSFEPYKINIRYEA